MPIRNVRRGAAVLGAATPSAAPLYVNSTTNTLKYVPTGSGTTEVEIVDASSTQTLTNKTISGGAKVNSINASGAATVTLTAAQSGKTFLFDSAAGVAYTLPVPTVGMNFRFLVTVLQTSGANVVVTDSASTFQAGTVVTFSGENVTPSATLGPKQFAGNGTTHIKTTTNGTTTGGGVGTWLDYMAISTTVWYVTGVVNSPSGSIATPFST